MTDSFMRKSIERGALITKVLGILDEVGGENSQSPLPSAGTKVISHAMKIATIIYLIEEIDSRQGVILPTELRKLAKKSVQGMVVEIKKFCHGRSSGQAEEALLISEVIKKVLESVSITILETLRASESEVEEEPVIH